MEFKQLPLTIYERFKLAKEKYLPAWFGNKIIPKSEYDAWVDKIITSFSSNSFETNQKLRISLLKHFYYIHRFKAEGSNRYFVTDKLATMLLATDYTSILAEMVKLPFNTFTIDISNLGLTVDMTRFGTKPQTIREVLVYNNEEIPNCISMVFYLGGEEELFVINIDMKPGSNLVKNIEYGGSSDNSINKNSTTKAVMITMGIILFINSRSNDAVVVRPKRVFAKDSSYPACKLGASVINKFNYEGSGEPRSSHEIHVLKYPVRGHFRNQPCGAGRLEKEIIWIEPFFKGKERDLETTSKPSNTLL